MLTKKHKTLLYNLQDNCRLTKAHLQSIKYYAKHTVGLVQRAIFRNKELEQTKTTSPSAKREKTMNEMK